jgi:hypothetical protein
LHRVSVSALIDSGKRISEETFSKSFPNLDASTIPRTSPEK